MADCGMRLGHVGGTTPNPLKVLSRNSDWPRLPLVDRVLASVNPGMRAENTPELNRTTCSPSPAGSHDTPSRGWNIFLSDGIVPSDGNPGFPMKREKNTSLGGVITSGSISASHRTPYDT